MRPHPKYSYAPIIMIDDVKRKEWEALPQDARKSAMRIILARNEEFTVKNAIDVLANVIIDLEKRILELEKKDTDARS